MVTPRTRPCARSQRRVNGYAPPSPSATLQGAVSTAGECVIMGAMRQSGRTRQREVSSPTLARWGGAAACLAGASYGAAGYLDNPDASRFVIVVVVPVLAATTPALFLASLMGLYVWPGRKGGPLGSAALLAGSIGTVLGVFDGLGWWESDRWLPLYAVLTAVGLGILVGLYFWPRGGGGPLRKVALPVGLVGTVLGLLDGLDWWEPDWWVLLFIALTAAGLEMVFGAA
jgi:hypothetical protein